MSDFNLSYDVEDNVGILTVERPPVNAFRYQDLAKLTERLRSLPESDERVVAFTTEGKKTFSAGHDVNEFLDDDPADAEYRDEVYMTLLKTVYEAPMPIVVGVDGAAVGAGAIVASLCDIRVASPDASFAIPELNVGIIGGFGPMRRVLPDGVARHMLYTGEALSADRAHELGMVSELANDAAARTVELAKAIAANSPDALRAARAQVVESQPEWPIEEYRQERAHIAALREVPNTDEAAAAFLEDRVPEYEEPQYEP